MAKEKTEKTKEAFKTFYPSLLGKETRLTILGQIAVIRPEGYKASSVEEEKELQAACDDPRFHITDKNPAISHHEERIAHHEAEIEKHKKAIG